MRMLWRIGLKRDSSQFLKMQFSNNIIKHKLMMQIISNSLSLKICTTETKITMHQLKRIMIMNNKNKTSKLIRKSKKKR